MKIIYTIISITTLLLFSNCSTPKQQSYVYKHSNCVKTEKVDGKIIKNEIISFADTTIASLSGTMIDYDTKDPIPLVKVLLKNLTTQKEYKQKTNLKGKVNFIVPAGKYQFIINENFYSTHIKEELYLSLGENREIIVELGIGEIIEMIINKEDLNSN